MKFLDNRNFTQFYSRAGLGGGVPGDFLEREGMAEELLSRALATVGVVGGHGLFAAVVDIGAGMFPGEAMVVTGTFKRAPMRGVLGFPNDAGN